ncbi:hypothetical protein TNCT1_63130 [Streptomyces sp. 1-11]|nr:hypothetical protein TNCT1_63130 [Streptomyces sp. 1-11]
MWERIDAEPGDLSDILDAAHRVAAVDGDGSAREGRDSPSCGSAASEPDAVIRCLSNSADGELTSLPFMTNLRTALNRA